MVKIAVDTQGGDYAPQQVIQGAAQFIQANSSLAFTLQLIGDTTEIERLLQQNKVDTTKCEIIQAGDPITMHESPTKALKEKPNSSISIGFNLLATTKTDAFLSAGNTGAMLVGAMYVIKPIEGVLRPTIGAYMPKTSGKVGILLDVGLNADCKPENLNQFAELGSLFAKYILNSTQPQCALVNIGEEEGKGNLLTQAAYPLLQNNSRIDFIGNIEGRDILTADADVMVCEGFTGNVVLKFGESFYDIVKQRNIQDAYLERFNYENYGGVPILGINKPVIIGHGISNANAVENMIETAYKMVASDLCGKIKESFSNSAAS